MPPLVWAVLIIVFGGALSLLLFEVAHLFGLSTYVDYGETIFIDHGIWDEERDGHHTGIGWFLIVISIVVVVRSVMAISAGNLNGGVSRLGNLQLGVWIVCFLIFVIIEAVIYFFVDNYGFPSILGNILILGSMIGIAYLGLIFYHKQKSI